MSYLNNMGYADNMSYDVGYMSYTSYVSLMSTFMHRLKSLDFCL